MTSLIASTSKNPIENHIRQAYQNRYPTLRIRHIAIQQPKETFIVDEGCLFRLSSSTLKKNQGSILVRCGRRSRYFRFTLDGDIGVYKATHQIKKDKIVSLEDVRFTRIPFRRLTAGPVDFSTRSRYMARQHIAAGRTITERMIKPLPAVMKHDKVRCTYKEGAVTIEFEAEALQNGDIGEMITLKRSDGKSLRAVVTGKREVEIR